MAAYRRDDGQYGCIGSPQGETKCWTHGNLGKWKPAYCIVTSGCTVNTFMSDVYWATTCVKT